MKHLLLALLLALTVGCAKVAPSVEVLAPAFLTSIKPVQYLANDGQALANGCSAFSIHRENHTWMTAAHCVDDVMFIAGQPATLAEAKDDVAVLQVDGYTAAGELYRALNRPNFGTEVMIAGHPFGYDDVFITYGRIANPFGFLNGEGKPYMLLDVAAAPGNSGSAVLNKDGDVVSVLQVGWGPRNAFSPVSGGATFIELEWFDRYFAKKGQVGQ